MVPIYATLRLRRILGCEEALKEEVLLDLSIDGRKVRERREELLLSRRDLAEKTGGAVSVSTLERIEQSGAEGAGIWGRTARALAEALEVENPTSLLVRSPGKALAG